MRIILSAIAALIAGGTAVSLSEPFSLVFSYTWLSFSLVYLLQAVIVMIRTEHHEIASICENEDVGTWIFFGIVLMCCNSSLAIAIHYINASGLWKLSVVGTKLLCIGFVACSWLVLHMSFAFRYAHLYYGHQNQRYKKSVAGLSFPQDNQPDYLDFAYFSFVVGMTFQVSDVTITAKPIRRLALLHGMISFVFNTVIVALIVSQLIAR